MKLTNQDQNRQAMKRVNAKKGEIEFERRAAVQQAQTRIDFDPLVRDDKWWKWRTGLVDSWLFPSSEDIVLDVGAASCEMSEFLASKGCHVVALDISSAMLLISKKRTGKRRSGYSLEHVTGDCERLPFRDGKFDKILCLETLHHLPYMQGALREISRCLRKGGTCLICNEPNNLDIFRKVVCEWSWKGSNLERSCSAFKLRSYLAAAGLKIIKMGYSQGEAVRNSPWTRHRSALKDWLARNVYRTLGDTKPFSYLFGNITISCQK